MHVHANAGMWLMTTPANRDETQRTLPSGGGKNLMYLNGYHHIPTIKIVATQKFQKLAGSSPLLTHQESFPLQKFWIHSMAFLVSISERIMV